MTRERNFSFRVLAIIILIPGALVSTVAVGFAASSYLNQVTVVHDTRASIVNVSLNEFTNTSSSVLIVISISNPHSTPVTMTRASIRVYLNQHPLNPFLVDTDVPVMNSISHLVNLTFQIDRSYFPVLTAANITSTWNWGATGDIVLSTTGVAFDLGVSWPA